MSRSERNSPLNILFEDENLVVIHKPAGIPVYPFLADALIAASPPLACIGPPGEAGLVHRLDNETSGVLVAARTASAYERLKEEWNRKTVLKEYTALVLGVAPFNQTVDFAIAHHPSNRKKMVVCETPERMKILKGRPAVTALKRLQLFRSAAGEYSLVSVRIQSGVRHQIRVHLAAMGYPIVGDRLYQNPQKRKLDRIKLERHFLHLGIVELNHPERKTRIRLEAPLPAELTSALKDLKAGRSIIEE